MKHYEMAEWTDFARALAPEPDLAAMQQHLSDGCPECREAAEFSNRLSAVCREMVAYEVPESTVRLAHSIFSAQKSSGPKRVARIA